MDRTRDLAAHGAAVAAARAAQNKAEDAVLVRRSRANVNRLATAKAKCAAAIEAARAALDGQTRGEILAHLSTGGTFGRFGDHDAETVTRFREHFGSSPETTCGHSLIDTVARLRWTSRLPDRLLCAECEAKAPAVSVPDMCDRCRSRPAVGFREVPIPAGTQGDGNPPVITPPIDLFLRLCESCE